jgi:hypothetical protein
MAESALLPEDEAENLSVELSKEVLTVLAPDELPFFSDVVQGLRDGHKVGPGSETRDEPLGFGIELSLLAPYVISVMPSVVNFLGQVVTASAQQEAAAGLSALIRKFFKRPQEKAGRVRLTLAQGQAVRTITYDRAITVGLDKERAGLLADAVVGSISVGDSDEH